MRLLAALLIASIVAPAARATVYVVGAPMSDVSLPPSQSPAVTVQLQHPGGPCWETVLPAPADRSDVACWKDTLP